MTKQQEKNGGSDWLEEIVGGMSILSLLGSLALAWPLVGAIGPGFYFGTQLLLVGALALQGCLLFVAMVIPLAIHVRRKHAMPSRGVRILAIAAVLAVLIEAAAVWLIPVTGNC